MQGDPDAIAAITPPCELPECLEHLLHWSAQLDREREYDDRGARPLRSVTLDTCARLRGWTLTPMEVDALFLLDDVKRFPTPEQGSQGSDAKTLPELDDDD